MGFKRGSKVFHRDHPQWGLGEIVDVPGELATVRFEGEEQTKFSLVQPVLVEAPEYLADTALVGTPDMSVELTAEELERVDARSRELIHVKENLLAVRAVLVVGVVATWFAGTAYFWAIHPILGIFFGIALAIVAAFIGAVLVGTLTRKLSERERGLAGITRDNLKAQKVRANNAVLNKARMDARVNRFRLFVLSHYESLMRSRNQLIYTGRYGEMKYEKWQTEVEYFVHNILPHHLALPELTIEAYFKLIDEIVVNYHNEQLEQDDCDDLSIRYHDAMTGIEYENFCRQLLERAGCSVEHTLASGDQGVDLVVKTPDGRITAMQCKRAATPIGNKAVQEAAAGRAFYGADFAVVVSNQGYTPAAMALAEKNGVMLLHHSDLSAYSVPPVVA